MRLLIYSSCMVLAACSSDDPVVPGAGSSTSTDPGGGGGGGGGDPDPLDCGLNAHQDGKDCVCDGLYDWCDDSPDDCCAYYTGTFEIGIVSAKVDPFKDANNPWDWDGNIPNALLDG